MDAQVLKVVGAVAGIGGIALALFFWLFRDIVRKNIFPRLTTDQAYRTIRLLMILATVVALAGIASWAFAKPGDNAGGAGGGGGKERVLTLQLTTIGYETIAPAEIIETVDIPGGRGVSISDAAVDAAAKQVAAWMTERGSLSPHESVTVTVTPSGDPNKVPAIEVTPMVDWVAYSVHTPPGGKAITQLASSSTNPTHPWSAPDLPWDLQVSLAGHGTIFVPSTSTAPSTHTSPRAKLGFAVEDRAGSIEQLAPRLIQRLGADARFAIMDSTSLAHARELIRNQPAPPDTGPDSFRQIDLRVRYGFSYVVTCSVRVK